MPETANSNSNSLSRTDLAVAAIRNQILDLTLEPGCSLDEHTLMERFDLGRTPIREALGQLKVERLVDVHANKGTFVRALDIDQLRQFFEIYHICGRMLARFCDISSKSLLADLQELQEQYREASVNGNFLDLARINQDFHMRLALEVDNEYVYVFSTLLHNHSRRLSNLIRRMNKDNEDIQAQWQSRAIDDHDAIIEALHSEDRGSLERILRRHSKLFQKAVQRSLGSTRIVRFSH